jgi:hypothetical protein
MVEALWVRLWGRFVALPCPTKQALILLVMKNQMLRPATPTARRRPPPSTAPGENAPRQGWPDYGRATPSLRQPIPGRLSHPDCRSVLTLIAAPQYDVTPLGAHKDVRVVKPVPRGGSTGPLLRREAPRTSEAPRLAAFDCSR